MSTRRTAEFKVHQDCEECTSSESSPRRDCATPRERAQPYGAIAVSCWRSAEKPEVQEETRKTRNEKRELRHEKMETRNDFASRT